MQNAFTAGVKPGGLNDSRQIRVLLCYLVHSASPLARQTLEEAVLQEQLVNCFELADALTDLEESQLILEGPDGYTLTNEGAIVAQELESEIPLTVRECALHAVLRIKRWKSKLASNHAVVKKVDGTWQVECTISDSEGEMLNLRLAMPDVASAEIVKNRFIAHGSDLYGSLLDFLTNPSAQNEDPTKQEGLG